MSRIDELTIRVARAWQDIIGVPVSNPDDDFFELGGHSVLATRVVARLRGELGPAVELRMIYEAPLLGDFVQAIAERIAAAEPGPRASD